MKNNLDLSLLYHRIVTYNLWRRGYIDVEPCSPKELGETLDAAAGVIYEAITAEVSKKDIENVESANADLEKRLEDALERGNRQCMRANDAEQSLKYCESANEYLKERLEKAEAERDQARKELADLWKQCRDTLAEDEHETDPKI